MDGIIALPVAVVYQENHYEDNKRLLLTTGRYNIIRKKIWILRDDV
jgi:hypothetical protein